MKLRILPFVLLVVLVPACTEHADLWHDQRLPSGRTVKVLACHLAWGSEEDGERTVSKDTFALEYVATEKATDVAAHEREAKDAFELIRGVSETWGFRSAEVVAQTSPQRRGPFVIYQFSRSPSGEWASRVFYAKRS
jgi:hypothetical protein